MSPPTLAIFLPSLAGGGAERMMINLAAVRSPKGSRSIWSAPTRVALT
jgi:hypothetical protein